MPANLIKTGLGHNLFTTSNTIVLIGKTNSLLVSDAYFNELIACEGFLDETGLYYIDIGYNFPRLLFLRITDHIPKTLLQAVVFIVKRLIKPPIFLIDPIHKNEVNYIVNFLEEYSCLSSRYITNIKIFSHITQSKDTLIDLYDKYFSCQASELSKWVYKLDCDLDSHIAEKLFGSK